MTHQDAIQKAMKLLAKGNDKATSQEESALFLSKAQEIIDQYNLDVNSFEYDKNQAADDAEPIQDFGYEDALDKVKYGQYREVWTRRLAYVVANHNQCRTVYFRTADKGVVIKIIGRASDVTLVRYLYSFFKRQVEELAGPACSGHSTAYRGQFCMGVLDTLYRRLNAQRNQTFTQKRQEQANNSMALVRVNNAIVRLEKRAGDVQKFIDANMTLKSGRGFNPQTKTGGREHGQREGEKIRLTKAGAALGGGTKQIS